MKLFNIVVVQHTGVLGKVLGHTGRGRVAEGQQTRTRLDQQAIRMAVVTAFEFHNGVTPGEAPGQTNRAHGRFGTGTHQANLFQ